MKKVYTKPTFVDRGAIASVTGGANDPISVSPSASQVLTATFDGAQYVLAPLTIRRTMYSDVVPAM